MFFKVVIIAQFDCCHRLGGADIDRTPNFIRQYSISVQKRETETGGVQEVYRVKKLLNSSVKAMESFIYFGFGYGGMSECGQRRLAFVANASYLR